MKKIIKIVAVLTVVTTVLTGCSDIKIGFGGDEDYISGDAPLNEVGDDENSPSFIDEYDTPSESADPVKSTEQEEEAEPTEEPVPSKEEPAPETPKEEAGAAPNAAVSPEEDLLILVNPTHFIPEGFSPELANVQGNYNMSALAAGKAKELIEGARNAGYSLMVVSGYRTVETSRRLYNNKVQQYLNAGYGEAEAKTEAARWVAPPGTSEHHTGLAMDIVSSDYFNYYADLEHAFENFDEFKWLYENCADYGFILRFPKDKQDITGITYEPWHYRYVGVENAKEIMSRGICLEEYLENR